MHNQWWKHPLTFHWSIHEKGIAIVGLYLCQCMVEWHVSNSTLSNNQQVGIVAVAFHLRQSMVEWHESHST
jgi:hypothetical protein